MNIYKFLTVSSPLNNQFGRVDINLLSKLCKSKFSEDVYILTNLKGRKPEKVIVKMKKLSDWEDYFYKIADNNSLFRAEIVDAKKADWTLIIENLPKKKSIVITKLSDHKDANEMYYKHSVKELKNYAEEVIKSENFENTLLYKIYNWSYRLIGLSSILIIIIVSCVLIVKDVYWIQIWKDSVLRGILIYSAFSLSNQIAGLQLGKYPNLLWPRKESENEDDQVINKKLLEKSVLNSNFKYIAALAPSVIIFLIILYYVVFLP